MQGKEDGGIFTGKSHLELLCNFETRANPHQAQTRRYVTLTKSLSSSEMRLTKGLLAPMNL